MKTQKNLGIYMDHAVAELIDLNPSANKQSITSEFTSETEGEALKKGESLMHNKQQQMHEAFYKDIAHHMLNYTHVLLFGPTNAKNELRNYLAKDQHFKDITIDVETTDKMSANEKHAFVTEHFKN